MRKRRKFTAAFKSKVALEALREEKPISAIAARHGSRQMVHHLGARAFVSVVTGCGG